MRGRLNFELLSLVVSAVNSCPTCAYSHEDAVRHEAGTQELLFDRVRLGAVVGGLCVAAQEFD